ncbi:hypothetical protein MNBD_GAMMA09-871 [hydrothermal vent metagenome]|uniref:Uncharacterized protein n=1 Tax=hydrothermal vent metagenome TaxID=652676 RepID=A0A3B0XM00_9ZZZZ
MVSGFVAFTLILIFKGRDLGYLKFHLGLVILMTACFIPLFYGSVGSFFQWQYAGAVYEKSWLAFVLSPLLLFCFIFVMDKVLS